MRNTKWITLASVGLGIGFAGSAMATPILTYGSANPMNVFFDGSTLTLNDDDSTITPKDGQGAVAIDDTVEWTGLSEVSYNANATSFDELLSSGTFNIGAGLLTGTFSSADLTGGFASNVGFVQYNGVVFTGGLWLPSNFSDTIGTALSTEFNLPSGTTWADFGNQDSLGAFQGSDATTASGTPIAVPEPATSGSLGIGALVMLLFAAIARRKMLGNTL